MIIEIDGAEGLVAAFTVRAPLRALRAASDPNWSGAPRCGMIHRHPPYAGPTGLTFTVISTRTTWTIRFAARSPARHFRTPSRRAVARTPLRWSRPRVHRRATNNPEHTHPI